LIAVLAAVIDALMDFFCKTYGPLDEIRHTHPPKGHKNVDDRTNRSENPGFFFFMASKWTIMARSRK
jgi:hypothetical protein